MCLDLAMPEHGNLIIGESAFDTVRVVAKMCIMHRLVMVDIHTGIMVPVGGARAQCDKVFGVK
jgi:hypothetical protein